MSQSKKETLIWEVENFSSLTSYQFKGFSSEQFGIGLNPKTHLNGFNFYAQIFLWSNTPRDVFVKYSIALINSDGKHVCTKGKFFHKILYRK